MTQSPSPLTGIGELNALLGRSTEYEGKLAFEGAVRIDGKFTGEVHSTDILVVGESAEIRGVIHVGTLIVRGGTVWADVHALQAVELYNEGQLHGDIYAPQVFIERGVVFEGRCTMQDKSKPSDIVTFEDP